MRQSSSFALHVLLTSLLWLVLGMAGAHAQGARVVTEHVEAELIAEHSAVVPGQPFTVALRIQHAPHWHTYWRNPGDSGIATQIAWRLPEGFKASPIQWPHPKRLPVGPLANFGYEDEVLLLTEIDPGTALAHDTLDRTVTLAARADWLVCKDICLPENGSFRVTLPIVPTADQAKPDTRWQAAFSRARAALPVERHDWTLSMTALNDAALLTITPPATFADTLRDVQFFPFREGLIENAAAQPLERQGNHYTLRIPLAAGAQLPANPLETLSGIVVAPEGWGVPAASEMIRNALLTGADPGQVVTVEPLGAAGRPGQLDAVPGNALDDGSSFGLLSALVFAFVGGLILNLMPCVFPVLGIKVMTFIGHAGHDIHLLRRQGLLFLAGVLVSFLALAALLSALRAGGAAIGWGFQLQSPAFIVVLAMLFTLLALNLFGVFEIGTPMPQSLGDFRPRGFSAEAFFTGVLATAVATPCTAPFMGAAMGYTLTQPHAVSFLVFASLALGMAAPVVLLSWFPAALRWLPRPGAWMLRFKQFMAFPLLATVIWLAWVLGAQTGNDGVMRLLSGLLLVTLAAWLFGVSRRIPGKLCATVIATVGAILAWPGTTMLSGQATATVPPFQSLDTQAGRPTWQPYSHALLQQLRADNQPVFIDFTAKWCITCQVNKQVALHDAEVAQRFAQRGVATLQADWTQRDPAITEALAGFGRNAVPLYVLYIPGREQPVILPELLTPRIVMDALGELPVQAPR